MFMVRIGLCVCVCLRSSLIQTGWLASKLQWSSYPHNSSQCWVTEDMIAGDPNSDLHVCIVDYQQALSTGPVLILNTQQLLNTAFFHSAKVGLLAHLLEVWDYMVGWCYCFGVYGETASQWRVCSEDSCSHSNQEENGDRKVQRTQYVFKDKSPVTQMPYIKLYFLKVTYLPRVLLSETKLSTQEPLGSI